MTSAVVEKWIYQLKRIEPFVFTIDDENIISFIEVNAAFTKPKFTAKSLVTVEVIIR